MAEDKILLSVELDQGQIGQAIKGIRDARIRIDELKASQAELKKQGQQNSVQYIAQEQEIKRLNASVNENSRIIQANTTIQKANENSINALREANKQLTKERNSLNTETEEGRKRIAEINEQIDSNNEKIKENVSSLEQQKINVGNYSGAVNALLPGLSQFTEGFSALSESAKQFADDLEQGKEQAKQQREANDELKASIRQLEAENRKLAEAGEANAEAIANNNAQIEGLKGQLSTGTSAAGGMVEGLKNMTRAALAFLATPLGIAIAAIAAAFKLLQTFINNSAAGMDLFEDITASVGTVINVLADRVVMLVGALGKLLSGDFKGALSGIKDTFSGIGDEIEREIKLTFELNAAIRDLEDAEVDFEIAASKNSNTIARLILQAKNRTATEKERIALINEAMKLEAAQTEQLIKNRQEALRIANEEANQRVGLARLVGETEREYAERTIVALRELGPAGDEYRDKILEAIKSRDQAEGQSISFQEKLQNQRDALEEKAEADRQKRAEKARAEREKQEEEIRRLAENEAKAVQELTIFSIQQDILRTQSVEERVEKEIALERVKQNFLLQNEQLTSAERRLIEDQTEAAISAIRQKGLDDRRALDEADLQRRKEGEEAWLQYEIEQAELRIQADINEEKEKLLNGQITREEYDQMMLEAEVALLTAIQQINNTFGQQDLVLAGQLTDAKIALKQYEKDTSIMLEQQKADAVAAIFGQSAALFNKNTIAYKLLASAEAVINTYKAATSAFSAMSGIPIVGPALGAVAAGVAIATGLANVAKINSVKIPKLAQGGIIPIEGKDHSQGGEIVKVGGKAVAEVQGGEHLVVLKRGANTMLQTLARANKLAGGKDFYVDRKPQRYLADGGFVATTARERANSSLDINRMGKVFSDAVAQQPAPILFISELNKVNNNIAKVAKVSELG